MEHFLGYPKRTFIYFGTSTTTCTPVRKGREHERNGQGHDVGQTKTESQERPKHKITSGRVRKLRLANRKRRLNTNRQTQFSVAKQNISHANDRYQTATK